jgi:8-oxo-dGTP pyrophosphatase MutT (NUDIX family)
MLIRSLEKRLQEPLPGEEFQFKMAAHASRAKAIAPPPDAREASVLILLYPRRSNWHVVFIERVSNKKDDRHSGQISFPGGKLEDSDPSPAYAALRETEEEVGVDMSKISLLGKLTDLYIPVSNFQVYPFVGFMEEEPVFFRQESEVASILEAPLDHLRAPHTRQTTHLSLQGGITLPDVPYFNVKDHIVWGATAMMLNEFLELFP